jgi:hypothetical protein
LVTPKGDLSSYSNSNLIPSTKRQGDNHAAPAVAVRVEACSFQNESISTVAELH